MQADDLSWSAGGAGPNPVSQKSCCTSVGAALPTAPADAERIIWRMATAATAVHWNWTRHCQTDPEQDSWNRCTSSPAPSVRTGRNSSGRTSCQGPYVHTVPRRNLLGIQLPPGLSFFYPEKLVKFVCDLIRKQHHGAAGVDAFHNLWTRKYSSQSAG